MKKLHFFSKNVRLYATFNDQSFTDSLTNNIVSFEKLSPDLDLITRIQEKDPSHALHIMVCKDVPGYS